MPFPFLIPVIGAAAGAVIGMVIGKEIDDAICKGELLQKKCPKCKRPLKLLMIKNDKGEIIFDQSEIEQVKIKKNKIYASASASIIGAFGLVMNIREKLRYLYVWHCEYCDFQHTCTVDDVSIEVEP